MLPLLLATLLQAVQLSNPALHLRLLTLFGCRFVLVWLCFGFALLFWSFVELRCPLLLLTVPRANPQWPESTAALTDDRSVYQNEA